jgi:hypothetical protein
MAAGLFAALYLLWALHWRVGRDLLSPAAALSSSCSNGSSSGSGWSWRVWLGQEAAKLGVSLLVLFQLAWPWGVAVSRWVCGSRLGDNQGAAGRAGELQQHSRVRTPTLGLHTLLPPQRPLRFRDNRHNASDIVGGLLLGACFAPLFVAHLITHFAAWADIRAREEQQQQHSAAPSPSSVLPIVAPGHVSSSASSGVAGGARVPLVSLH